MEGRINSVRQLSPAALSYFLDPHEKAISVLDEKERRKDTEPWKSVQQIV